MNECLSFYMKELFNIGIKKKKLKKKNVTFPLSQRTF